MQIDHQQPDEPNRNIHEKNESPVQISDDETARNRSKHGADQSWDRHKTHRADELGFRKGSHQSEPAYRHHHGSAAALQDAAGHKQMNVAGNAAKKRSQREKPN